jgi:glycosyltransferase involved in cell wall biosynthesis
MKIHQLVPALHDGDAIGDSARAMRGFLRHKGYSSDIYAYTIDESLSTEALNFGITQPRVAAEDVLILHFALPSGMTEFLKHAVCKKAIIYHNITPSYYWLNYDPALVHLASAGRKELESLAPFVDRAAGDSEFNRQELQTLAFRNTCVIPIYVKQERYNVRPSPMVTRNINDGLFNFLFVGRVAPNKKLEDVLALYALYKRMFNPLSRLIFVGKTNVTPAYTAALNDLRVRLALMPEDVLYTGHVDWSELVAYYKGSHVFVSMSEHEGFCVPLVEAMICEIPIVAYSTTAIPFTLGDSGVQFKTKNYPEIAGLCRKIEQDPAFRESVLENQRKQLLKYSKEEIEKAINQFLEPLV